MAAVFMSRQFTVRFVGGPYDGTELHGDDPDPMRADLANKFFAFAKRGEVGAKFKGLSPMVIEALGKAHITGEGAILSDPIPSSWRTYGVISNRRVSDRNVIEIEYQGAS